MVMLVGTYALLLVYTMPLGPELKLILSFRRLPHSRKEVNFSGIIRISISNLYLLRRYAVCMAAHPWSTFRKVGRHFEMHSTASVSVGCMEASIEPSAVGRCNLMDLL